MWCFYFSHVLTIAMCEVNLASHVRAVLWLEAEVSCPSLFSQLWHGLLVAFSTMATWLSSIPRKSPYHTKFHGIFNKYSILQPRMDGNSSSNSLPQPTNKLKLQAWGMAFFNVKQHCFCPLEGSGTGPPDSTLDFHKHF